MIKQAQLNSRNIKVATRHSEKLTEGWIDITGSEISNGMKYDHDSGTWSDPETLEGAKVKRLASIKSEAGNRISVLDWQLQRAARHVKLSRIGKKGELEVLQLQQDVEEASDQAEITVSALTSIEDVRNFTW